MLLVFLMVLTFAQNLPQREANVRTGTLVFEFGIAFANAARKLARAFVAAEFKFLGVPDLGDAQPQFVEARAARGLTPCTEGRTEPFDTSRRSAKACRIGVWPADAGKAS